VCRYFDHENSARSISWCICALLLVSCLRAQNPADSPSVTIRSNVRLVQIDVIAKDKRGNPVSGLEAKDFTLLDDGVAQKVTRISVERSASESDSGSPTPAAGKQRPLIYSNTHPENVVPTVILFDALNTALEDQASMEKALVQSLARLKEGTPIALLILGDDLNVVSDFTTSSISLSKTAERGFHLREEGFGPGLNTRKTGNPVADAMIRKVMIKAFHADERVGSRSNLTAKLADFR